MNRRSPLAEGWRPSKPPHAVPFESEADKTASADRWASWNRATLIFAAVAGLYFLLRPWL